MKNMKKTALAVFTVCVFVMCTVLFTANVSAADVVDSGECGDRLTWVLYTDGELVIHGKGEIWNYSVAQLAPWYDYCESITSVSIGNGVTAIGDFSL